VIPSALPAHKWSPARLGLTDDLRDDGCQTCYECDLPDGHELGDLPCDCRCWGAS
jgi:hypothetical protein